GVLIGYSGLGDPLKAGMEIQIIDEERLKSRALPAKRRTGAIYDAVGPATPAPLRPLQEWNTLRVRCEGDAVEVAINGSKTVSVNLREHEKLRHVSHSGRIGFLNWQGEAQGVAFRKIRLRKLGQPSASPPQTPPSQRTPSEPQPDPTAGTQNRRRADEANKRGNAWAEQDEFDKAIADCRLGLQNQPDNVLMRQLLAGLTTPAGPAGPGESAVSRSCPIRGRLPHQETGSHRQKAPAESD
ncbi:MAG: DUF1080 domain-containing protein, partial [Planctomycetes bacterium]|nr:DUF1080 domain-containing protein [Planctomycetota bacterium]